MWGLLHTGMAFNICVGWMDVVGQEWKEEETHSDEAGLQKGTWLGFGFHSKNKRDASRTYPNLRIMNQTVHLKL